MKPMFWEAGMSVEGGAPHVESKFVHAQLTHYENMPI